MSVLDRIRRMIRPRRLGPLSCRELVEIVTEYLEGSLGPQDRARFDAHIEGCDGCRTYLEQMRLVILATGHLTEEDISTPAREALLASFRTWNKDQP